jgi:hypothetical protein
LSLSIAEDDGPGKGTGEPDPVPADVDKEYRRIVTTLEFFHQASCKLGFGIVLPHLQVEVDDLAGGTSGEDAGFHDVRGYLLWSPWAPEEPEIPPLLSERNLHFQLGISLPTAPDRVSSDPVEKDGQLGSGSVDFRLSATYWGYVTPEWCVFASTGVVLDTGYDLSGYRNSPSYSLRLGGGWLPIPEAQLYLSFRTNYSGRNFSEPEPDGIDADSGGVFWYLMPGAVFKPTEQVLIDVSGSFPLYHRVHGSQVLPGITWTIGVSFKW